MPGTYIWIIYGVNVNKYAIHGAMGYGKYANHEEPMICKSENNIWETRRTNGKTEDLAQKMDESAINCLLADGG